MARTFATNQRELLAILEAFERVTETGDQAAWTDARNRYTNWFNRWQPMIQEGASQMSALGISCS